MIRIFSIALLILVSLMPATAMAQYRKATPAKAAKVAPKPQPRIVVVQPYVVPPQLLMMQAYQREQQRMMYQYQLEMQRQAYQQQLYLQWRRFWYGF